MYGGVLQLVTKGIDDIFLTSEPQITLFKTVYRRYTNFNITQKDLYFRSNVNFENITNIKLKRAADLINRLYLKITLLLHQAAIRTIKITTGERYKIYLKVLPILPKIPL